MRVYKCDRCGKYVALGMIERFLRNPTRYGVLGARSTYVTIV